MLITTISTTMSSVDYSAKIFAVYMWL